MVRVSEIVTFGGVPMSGLLRHPGRVVSLALGALVVTALAFNGPVAAGESSGQNDEPASVVTETVGDLAPMIAPMEDVDDSDVSADAAPMVEPMEDVDDSDVSADAAPMIDPIEDVDE
jgi:hypothetical protein